MSAETRICPYCGGASNDAKQCEHCRGLFEPLSRQASQNAMGPWYVRDEANPFRPGCSYATLRVLVMRGKLTTDAVIRGPSTRQFWMLATAVPGVAHLFGACHSCRAPAKRSDAACGQCGASFLVEDDRQYLGLAEVRLIPGQASAEEIVHAAKRAASGGASGQSSGATMSLVSTETGFSSGPVLHPEPDAAQAEPIPMLAVPESEPEPEIDAPARHRMSGEARMAEFDRMRNGYDRDSGRGSRQRAMIVVVMALAGAGAIMVIVMWALSVSAVIGKGAGTQSAPLQAGVPMNTAPPPIAPGPVPNPTLKKP